MVDIAASVLSKLKIKAKSSGISYQQCLQLFMQEEFLRKLSKSGYDDCLVLKGGLFIYAAIMATISPFMLRITTKEAFAESLRAYLILNSSSRKEGKSDIVLLKNSITSNSDSDTISGFILQFNFQ